MTRNLLSTLLVVAILAPLAAAGCSGQKTEEPAQVAEQPPPPSPESAPPAREAAPEPPSRPKSRTEHRSTAAIPEERPQRLSPPQPAEPTTVSVTIPKGTSLALAFVQPLTSETAAVGDAVTAQLRSPIIVGDRVAFPAGSQVEGRVSDVKSAKKGFKDTGGALAVSFDRIVTPDGRSVSIAAGFTKLAEGSGKKKAAIIGGSAAGAALLGSVLGKDAKGAALVGGAIGTAVAGSTKGKEARIAADEEVTVALEQAVQTTIRR